MPDSAANAKYVTDAHIDWELYKKIILEGEKYGCPALNPQGVNEPLLSPDLEDHIKFASQHGFLDIMMNTNATLLSEERTKKLLDSGLTRIRFSLDSATEELYKKVRVGGNYDTVIKNIERFIEMRNASGSKLPVVGVNFVRMSVNEHEEELFIKKWENKADFIAFQEFMPPETEFDYRACIQVIQFTILICAKDLIVNNRGNDFLYITLVKYVLVVLGLVLNYLWEMLLMNLYMIYGIVKK
jgi:sulfatase maturation enzyme AslB (radical SAM superfamily)